jgi:hypothetical protein
MKTARRFVAVFLVAFPLSYLALGISTAGAGPLPEARLSMVACEECGEPDLPAPTGEPGDAEVDVIIRAVADALLGGE